MKYINKDYNQIQEYKRYSISLLTAIVIMTTAFLGIFLTNITPANAAGSSITTPVSRTTVVDRSDTLNKGGQIGSVRTQHSSDTTLTYPQYVRAGQSFQYQRCVTQAYFGEVGVYATSINKVDIDGTSTSFAETKTQTSSSVALSLCKTYSVTAPTAGSTTLNIAAGSVTQYGAIGYSGTCCPGTGFSWTSTTNDNTLNFLAVYTPPSANDDGTFELEKSGSYEFSPLSNDYGVTGAQGSNNAGIIDRQIATQATNGTCTWDNSTSKITYVNNGTAGSDSCIYSFNQENTAELGPNNLSVSATANFFVTSTPTAQNDVATTNQNSDVDIDVLDNDFDEDGDAFEIQSVSTSLGFGSATIVGGKIRFSPGTDFVNLALGQSTTSSVSYVIVDARAKMANATIEVTITGLNDAPVAVNDEESTDKNTSVNISPLVNDSDIDTSDVLSLVSANITDGLGTATIEDNKIKYDPGDFYKDLVEGQSAIVTIEYTIEDLNSATSTASISVLVSGVDDPIIVPEPETPIDPVIPTIPSVPNIPVTPKVPDKNIEMTTTTLPETLSDITTSTVPVISDKKDSTSKNNIPDEGKINSEPTNKDVLTIVKGESVKKNTVLQVLAAPGEFLARNLIFSGLFAIFAIASLLRFFFIVKKRRKEEN